MIYANTTQTPTPIHGEPVKESPAGFLTNHAKTAF